MNHLEAQDKNIIYKLLILWITFICLCCLPLAVSADIGRHPTISLKIIKDGKVVNGSAIIFLDVFIAGGNDLRLVSKDLPYIKNMIESNEFESYFYCHQGDCNQWLYFKPNRIAVIYPSNEYPPQREMSSSAESDLKNELRFEAPRVYLSNDLKYDRNTFDISLNLNLNENGTIEVINKTPNYFVWSGIAFILTILLELLVARVYYLNKKMPDRLILVIVLINFISFPFVWFFVPFTAQLILSFIFGSFIVFAISEFMVWIIEAILLKIFCKLSFSYSDAFKLSFAMNLCSAILGTFIFYFWLYDFFDYAELISNR